MRRPGPGCSSRFSRPKRSVRGPAWAWPRSIGSSGRVAGASRGGGNRGQGGRSRITIPRGRGPVALVLLDVHMPGPSASETLRQLRELTPGLPCCLLTANPEEPQARRLVGAGAADILAKPFRLSEVAARVRALLGAA